MFQLIFLDFQKKSCYLGDAKPHHLCATPAKSLKGAKPKVPLAPAAVQKSVYLSYGTVEAKPAPPAAQSYWITTSRAAACSALA